MYYKTKDKKILQVNENNITYGAVEDILNILNTSKAIIDKLVIRQAVTKNAQEVSELLASIFDVSINAIYEIQTEDIINIFEQLTNFAISKLCEIATENTDEKNEFCSQPQTTIYQDLFDLTVSICTVFKNINPLYLRQQSANEVFKFISRVNDYNNRNSNEKDQPTAENNVIRRPATTWF